MSPLSLSTVSVLTRSSSSSHPGDDAVPDSPPDSTTSWLDPGAGLTPDSGDQAPALRVFVITVGVLAVYNAAELAVMALLTFRRYGGLYFWAVLVSGLAIIPYTIGFALDLLDVVGGPARYAPITLITVGWWPMVSGQAVVLWSRLHLIVPKGPRGERIVRWTGWMIVVDAVVFHLPTTVFTFGSAVDGPSVSAFARGYDVMEKIQMTGFFCQEVILSSIYVVETFRILRTSLQPDTRTTMRQLLAINAVIIAMDLGLLGLEAASYYILETMLKGVVYSIKLKLEFAILGKLVRFVGGGQRPGPGGAGPGGNNQVGYGGGGIMTPASTRSGLCRLPRRLIAARGGTAARRRMRSCWGIWTTSASLWTWTGSRAMSRARRGVRIRGRGVGVGVLLRMVMRSMTLRGLSMLRMLLPSGTALWVG